MPQIIEIELEITLFRGEHTMEFSDVVDEGEPTVLVGEGDSDWKMEITPEEVTQAADIEAGDKCPVCGDLTDEIVPAKRIGETIDVDRVCVADSEIEGSDCIVYFHQK
ncbi:hypothetical protein GCM10027355_09320 [Haloplanus salinarum]